MATYDEVTMAGDMGGMSAETYAAYLTRKADAAIEIAAEAQRRSWREAQVANMTGNLTVRDRSPGFVQD